MAITEEGQGHTDEMKCIENCLLVIRRKGMLTRKRCIFDKEVGNIKPEKRRTREESGKQPKW